LIFYILYFIVKEGSYLGYLRLVQNSFTNRPDCIRNIIAVLPIANTLSLATSTTYR
jgi:hypothetical protein